MHLYKIFRYYWDEIKKYKWSFFFTFIAYGAGVLLSSILNPYLYKKIIDLISGRMPTQMIADDLFIYLFWVTLTVLSYQAMYRIGDYLITHFQANVIREIHNTTFRRLLNHSFKFFSNNFAGSLVSKSKRFASSFERIADIISFSFWFTFVHLMGVLTILFIEAPFIAFLFLGWTVIYVFITVLFIKKKVTYDLLEAAADSRVTARFADAFTNILNIKIFSGKTREEKTFKDVTHDEFEKRLKSWRFGNFQNTVQGFLMGGLQIIILYVMINMWLEGSITTGMVVLIQIYMFAAFDHLWELGKSLVKLFKSLADAKEMVDLFEEKPDIEDKKNPEDCAIREGNIEFKNINFAYVKDFAVFKNFNLKIKPGEKVGIVGHSGAGKTTLVKILLRFADVKGGEILIDGQNVANLKQEDLRQNISYVPQEPILFHRSILENINYSKPGSSKEDIVKAAKKAHAHEFIMNLPHGYDTFVGERGIKLSGGERQRIAIARAMLKDAPILMLDEATSSLDSVSEHFIQDAFNNLMKGKTTIVIAHRLSTIQKMDRIIVLDKGGVVEEGSHNELLNKNGLYAELWKRQTGGFLE